MTKAGRYTLQRVASAGLSPRDLSIIRSREFSINVHVLCFVVVQRDALAIARLQLDWLPVFVAVMPCRPPLSVLSPWSTVEAENLSVFTSKSTTPTNKRRTFRARSESFLTNQPTHFWMSVRSFFSLNRSNIRESGSCTSGSVHWPSTSFAHASSNLVSSP